MAAIRCSPTSILAYDALSDGMKKMLSGLRAVHSTSWWQARKPEEQRPLDQAP